jgi:hypothetical protein
MINKIEYNIFSYKLFESVKMNMNNNNNRQPPPGSTKTHTITEETKSSSHPQNQGHQKPLHHAQLSTGVAKENLLNVRVGDAESGS